MTTRKAKAPAKNGQLVSPMYNIVAGNAKAPSGFVTGYPLSITKGISARPGKVGKMSSLVSKTTPGRVMKTVMY